MDREPLATRVTYVDADVAFFDNPNILLDEYQQTGADVFITEHAYAPEYDQSELSGIYCVQFITFNNSQNGRAVMKWWQERCVEWCYARAEDGKFGDQKYLDDWPDRFGAAVHILQKKGRALGPWNARMFCSQHPRQAVLFHFHGLRIVSPTKVLLTDGYRIDGPAYAYYLDYCDYLTKVFRLFLDKGWQIPVFKRKASIAVTLKKFIKHGRARYVNLAANSGKTSGDELFCR